MTQGRYENICIRGIAACVPEKVMDVEKYASELDDRRTKKQVKLTGIRRRHLCDKQQSASDFCTKAAEKLLTELKWNRNEIRVLLFVTQSPDLKRPATAMLIQKELKIGTDCLAFDVNLGCSGYTAGLQIVAALLQNIGGKGLLLAGEGYYAGEPSDWKGDDLLFGDGGSATAIEIKSGYPMSYKQKSDGNQYDVIMATLDGKVHMNGNAVLLFALNEVSNDIKNFCETMEMKEDEIDYYIFHQAQEIVLQGMTNEIGTTWDKVLTSYEEYGNTSSASIPITICHNIEGLREKKKQNLLLCGFGIGLSWGVVLITLDTDSIYPIEYTSSHNPVKDTF